MSTTVHWRASLVRAIVDEASAWPDGKVSNDGPRRDPVSNAVNNVRIASVGTAPHGSSATLILRAFQLFHFDVTSDGNLFASASLAPEGIISVAAASGGFWDGLAKVTVSLKARMSVNVFDRDGNRLRNVSTPFSDVLPPVTVSVYEDSRLDFGSVNTGPFDGVITRDMQLVVQPGFEVTVVGLYYLAAHAENNARYELDFGSFSDPHDPPGFGLNVPFASISVV